MTACWQNIHHTAPYRLLSGLSASGCSWCCLYSQCSVFRCSLRGATGMLWGTLSLWVTPRKAPFPSVFTSVNVDASCNIKCKNCARVCPMQITPYESRGSETGYLHADCIKCGKCVASCPLKIIKIKPQNQLTYDNCQQKSVSA